MVTTIKYDKVKKLEGSKNVKGARKITMFQDGVEITLDRYYYTLEGIYYSRTTEGWPFEVASSEGEFNEYLVDTGVLV